MTRDQYEIIFHGYFSRLPDYLREVYRGRLKMSDFEIQELADAFESIRQEINSRWESHAHRIVAPSGQVKLHLDYIDSRDLNAITFNDEGISFVGITGRMLVHIARTSEAMWRLNPLAELLGIELSKEVRDFLFQAVLLMQLQFLSSHELGHLFHGHIDPKAFREEFGADATGALPGDRLKDQAGEVDADGYGVHSLLDNLVTTENGKFIHTRLESKLSQEDCILTLFLLSVGILFFFLRPRAFRASNVRESEHPFALARMNVVLYDLIGWCELNRPGLEEWASLERFQRIMACVNAAANNPEKLQAWQQQGEFLRSADGKKYLEDLYAYREKLRGEMTRLQWTLLEPSAVA
jgi:hypothetical protein